MPINLRRLCFYAVLRLKILSKYVLTLLLCHYLLSRHQQLHFSPYPGYCSMLQTQTDLRTFVGLFSLQTYPSTVQEMTWSELKHQHLHTRANFLILIRNTKNRLMEIFLTYFAEITSLSQWALTSSSSGCSTR